MSLRNVTLTAVAALSFGMAAQAQTTTITVPLNQPGTAAPAATGPGTTVTLMPDGQSRVESSAAPAAGTTPATAADGAAQAAPAPAGDTAIVTPVAPTRGVTDAAQATGSADATGTSDATAGTDATGTAYTSATASEPAPAAAPAEAATTAESGTAAAGIDAATPTPTGTASEPPAAPKEGLPATATEAQVNAPVPATEGAVEAEAPLVDGNVAPQADGTAAPAAAPADAAPAADAAAGARDTTPVPVPAEVAEGQAPMQPAADGQPAAEGQPAAPADTAPAPASEAPAAIQNPDVVQTEPAASDAGAATETTAAAADGHAAPADGEAAASHATHQEIHDVAFSFEGPFGKFDQFQLQRGLQVYTEVCSGCHGMKQVPIRTLHDAGGPGLPEDQVRAYAAALSIVDADTGEERPRVPTDMFPTVTGEGMGPDLSLMAKARAGFHGPYGTGISQLFNGIGGPEYIYSILTGYTGETKEQAGTTFYENKAFPGGWIAMAPPLSDDQVTFEDGAPSDLHSAAKDISAYLMWTAEPKLMARKQVGLVSVLFLIVLAALLYLTNKRLWWPLKHGHDVVGDGR